MDNGTPENRTENETENRTENETENRTGNETENRSHTDTTNNTTQSKTTVTFNRNTPSRVRQFTRTCCSRVFGNCAVLSTVSARAWQCAAY